MIEAVRTRRRILPEKGPVMFRLATTIAIILVLGPTATAGLVGERSWKIASQDDRYLLVMVSPWEVTLFRKPYADAEIEFRKRYKLSGLYRNDESSEPIWTMPYHYQLSEAYISPDGTHVLIANETWDHTISSIPPGGSMFFYHQDGEATSYRDYELTWCFGAKWLVNRLLDGYFVMECEGASFDPQTLTYTVTTNLAEECVFDVATGKIVHRRSPWYFYFGIPILLVPAIVYGLRCMGARTDQRRAQFSVREVLVLVTLISIFLGLIKLNGILAVAYGLSLSVGGGIAWILSRRRRAWLVGAILSAYGSFLGLLLWARLSDFFFPVDLGDPMVVLGTFCSLLVIGFVAGAIFGGWIERRKRH